jgi:two-component system, sensor histidine kinase
VAVTRVENGVQALAELQRPDHPYDIVLMDCQMPELDGIEATRRLRAWEHHHGRPPVPVVALTANAMSSDRERCLAVGMNEHLAKPFKQDELRAVLMRHLQALHVAPLDQASNPA